jgi:hypothetical protein
MKVTTDSSRRLATNDGLETSPQLRENTCNHSESPGFGCTAAILAFLAVTDLVLSGRLSAEGGGRRWEEHHDHGDGNRLDVWLKTNKTKQNNSQRPNVLNIGS